MKTKKNINFKKIKLLVMDIDGVLTDGTLIIHSDGSESKCFNTLDGHGIKMWQSAGNMSAFLTGRNSQPVQKRAKELGVDFCIQNSKDKLPKLKELTAKLKLKAENIAYVGDDLPDLPAIIYSGFGATVPNAADEVRKNADYITKRPGGSGAVREIIEYILKKTGQWNKLVKQYLKAV